VELRVPAEAAGQRLDRYLSEHAGSRAQAARWIELGAVTVDGRSARKADRLGGGELLSVVLPDVARELDDTGPQAPFRIVYQDEDLLVVDKPAGVVVHPAGGHRHGTLSQALAALGATGGEPWRPGIVHRLDKDTSGLIVAAKTEFAHRALSRDFAARRIARAYAAIVWGVPLPAQGEIAGNIGRSMTNRKKMAVVGATRGKPAVTRYKLERAFGDTAALLECRLLTGRTHQIRVHLAERGHPLVGDPVYGGRGGRAGAKIAAFPRQALHARHLGFTHPVSGEYFAFDSDLPPDMAALLITLERL